MQGKSLLFNLFFILYYFKWHCNCNIPYGKFGGIFFSLLAICLHAENQCDPVIPSGDIYDHRIMQSDWLKPFLAITQEQ